MPTRDELKMLQQYPLDLKIAKTQLRIRDWVNYYGSSGVYVSFSGGKDSTVLLHIARQMYPDIEAVFVNTGLEYPEVQSFAKRQENTTLLRPQMRFDEVIKTYGYPFIGKDVALTIYYARQGKQWAINYFNGLDTKGREHGFKKTLYAKYKPLTTLDFLISSRCCHIMKEQPLHKYGKETGKVGIIGTLAAESERRQKAWLKTGCNAFDADIPTSKPLSFWTEQDILQYIKIFHLPIASVYGDIACKGTDGALYDFPDNIYRAMCLMGTRPELCATGCDRTGCIFCGFGAHLEKGETRYQRLKRTHPRQYEYCMGGGAYDSDGLWKPTKDGLGMAHCIDELNKIYGPGFIRY